ncbi:MAG: sensor histidine kinase [Lachnospiraceae bacterium]|nr:sensor histidine kinase [Lachnospiraceae bacterium]
MGGCHAAFQTICFLILWNIFCPGKREKKRVALAGILLTGNILAGVLPGLSSGIRYVVSAGVILAYVTVKEKKYREKAVFVLLLFFNFHGLSFLISSSIYQYGIDKWMEALEIRSMDDLSQVYQRILWGQGILILSYMLILLLMIGGVKKAVKEPIAMNWQEVLFLSVLNLVGGMLARMILDISMVKLEQEVFLLFDVKREMVWKVPVLAVLIYLGEISVIAIYQRYMELLEQQQKHFVKEQQMKAMEQKLQESEHFYGSIRKARHEMKNHMMNIKGLAAGEHYEALENYIEKLDETIETLDDKFVTGNPVTDVVINDKYRKAVHEGIDFQARFYYQKEDTVSAFDMGILLNNLLDNAIEACERLEQGRRYICLNLKQKQNFLFLEVENSFDGVFQWKEDRQILCSRKLEIQSDGSRLPGRKEEFAKSRFSEHGIGLKNVKEIAERYLGTMDIKINENVFKVTVMLQEKEIKEK